MHTRFPLSLALLCALLPVGLQAQPEIRLEAEDAEVFGQVGLESSRTGYTGDGYLRGFTNDREDYALFRFEAAGGLYDLTIRYATETGEKGYGLWVNGQAAGGRFPDSASFTEHAGGAVLLAEGENTIEIANDWGWYLIDFILLEPVEAAPTPTPPRTLSNPDASPSALALQSFLVDLYGHKILSSERTGGSVRRPETDRADGDRKSPRTRPGPGVRHVVVLVFDLERFQPRHRRGSPSGCLRASGRHHG